MAQTATKNPIEKIKQESDAPPAATKAEVAPRPVRHYRAWLFQGYVATAAVAFIALTFFAHTVNYFSVDVQIALAIQSINNVVFDRLMQYLTVLGFTPQVILILVLTVLYQYVTGLKWEAVMLLFSSFGASTLGTLIKLVVARPRPDANLVHVFEKLGEFSFPSGHVLFYVSLIGFLWFMSYTLWKPSWKRTLTLWVFGITMVLAGVSRIYLGEHWPSDVFGSYLLGTIWLWVSIVVYNWGKTRFFVRQPVASEAPRGDTRASQTG